MSRTSICKLSFLIFVVFSSIRGFSTHAAAQELSYARLDQISRSLLEADDVAVTKPSYYFSQDRLILHDAQVTLPWWGSIGRYAIPGEHILEKQIETILYRRHLFSDKSSRRFMEPYFRSMERVVDDQLKAVAKAGNDAEIEGALDELDRRWFRALKEGLDKWAISQGKSGFGGNTMPAAVAPDVEIRAPMNASIYIVPYTTHVILAAMKRDRDSYPWRGGFANGSETALLGKYYFKVVHASGQTHYLVKSASLLKDFVDLR